MSGLGDSQLAVIRAVIDSAPDNALATLESALSGQAAAGPMGQICSMVQGELGQRRARDLTFAPLLGLCPKTSSPFAGPVFPAKVPSLLWAAAGRERPELADAALAEAQIKREDDRNPEPFDLLCGEAAAGLRCPAGTAYAAVAELLDESVQDGSQVFGAYLDLAPLCRRVIRQLPDWIARMTDERAASVRVAYTDAVEIAPDAGPRFFDILQAQLAEPWLILRILSAVMFRPSDAYAASSELGQVGERLLTFVESQIDILRKFDPESGIEGGRRAADAARSTVLTLSEFEESIDLAKDGKWGGRVARHKQELAMIVEIRFRKTDDLVSLALPLKPARGGGRMMRGVPKLDEPPKPQLVARARGALAFLERTQSSAASGGYSSLRAKIIEKVADRLDHYVEDLLEVLRDPANAEHEQARAFLDIAAEFLALVRDEKAAQIVRRRAAA